MAIVIVGVSVALVTVLAGEIVKYHRPGLLRGYD